MRTDAQWIAAYNARMLSSLIDPTLAAKVTQQQANFAIYETDFYPKQVQLRTILDAQGAHNWQIGAYEAYHGELYHIAKVSSGTAAVAAATILVAKWEDLGLTAGILKLIANDIYGIVVP